jgi:hypothetical protein
MADTARLQELLTNITALTEDELIELRDLVASALEELSTAPDDSIVASADLDLLANAVTALENEGARRDAAVKKAAALRESFSSIVPADRRIRPASSSSGVTAVTASGMPLDDREALSEEFVRALKSGYGANRADGKTVVASVRASGELPRLHRGDRPAQVTQALVAAGGFGAAPELDYSFRNLGESAVRPVFDALPKVIADRGAVTYQQNLGVDDLDPAVYPWTVEQDIAALAEDGPRKVAHRVDVPDTITENVDAIVSYLLFGNLVSRAHPEFVDRCLDLNQVAWSREVERDLLSRLDNFAVAATVTDNGLGATRNILPVLTQALLAAQSRGRRLNATHGLIVPTWVRGLIRSDLAQQHPGDNALSLSDAEIDGYLRNQGLANVVFSPDLQAFNAAQADGAALTPLPTTLTAYVYQVGSLIVLDGGTLGLGVVRDSDLIATNDYAIFAESFLGLALNGPAPLRLDIPVSADGTSRAAV